MTAKDSATDMLSAANAAGWGDRDIGVTELSRRLGIGKSTAHRLLSTLAEERLLEDQQKQAELQLEAMKAAIAAGLASGRSIPGDQVFDRLEAKYRKQAASAGR